MPRLFHRPPKYGLHKGTNQAIVCHQGKLVYLGPYGSEKSHQRYREFLDEWKTLRHREVPPRAASREDRLSGTITPGALRERWRQGLKVSLDELIFVYRQHARSYYVKNGAVTREAELIEEVTALLGAQHGRDRVDDFGPVDLDEFRESLIDDRDWSRKFLNKQVTRLVAMFKWGAKKELCSPLVHQQLRALGGLKKGRTRARESEGVSCVEDAIVDKTLTALPEVVADMVRFQRLTGARPGEVCSLSPADIDRSSKVWLYRPDAHKTEHYEKHRVVPVGPKAQQLLQPYLLRSDEAYCFSPTESVEKARRRASAQRTTPATCGNTRGSNRVASPRRVAGDRYQVSSYRNAVRRACTRLDLTIWTPNQLRHTAATKIRQEYGLEAAQVICGHSRADVTQVYAERDLKLAIRVAEEVG